MLIKGRFIWRQTTPLSDGIVHLLLLFQGEREMIGHYLDQRFTRRDYCIGSPAKFTSNLSKINWREKLFLLDLTFAYLEKFNNNPCWTHLQRCTVISLMFCWSKLHCHLIKLTFKSAQPVINESSSIKISSQQKKVGRIFLFN